jgi:hypothetical protein
MTAKIKLDRPYFVECYTECASHLADTPIVHRYDRDGWHQLEVDGQLSTIASYAELTILKHRRKDGSVVHIAGATQHWWPELPEIFQIIPIKDLPLPASYNGSDEPIT